MINKNKLRSFTVEVIDFFLGIPESLITGFDRKEFYRLINGAQEDKQLTYSKIAQLISNFKRKGYIEVVTTNGKESIRFTSKARLSLIDKIALEHAAGENYYFISFDIPERLKTNRNQFRRSIKRLGFKQIQKSLWVCNKNFGDFIEFLTNEYRVNDYVVYMATENTNINETIKNLFLNINSINL